MMISFVHASNFNMEIFDLVRFLWFTGMNETAVIFTNSADVQILFLLKNYKGH